jgi:F0F1-type ATP synthase membrane subunit b/b'
VTPFAAAPAFLLLLAAEGEHAETFLGLPVVLWSTVNLIVFFGLVVYLARKPFTKFFGERRAEIEALLKKAEQDRRRAEALAGELAARLAQIETELAGVKAAAKVDAEAEHAALLKEAEREAGRLVERMSGEIESRVRHARAELTAYAGDLSLEMARELLQQKMTADDRTRLVANGVDAVAKAKA